MKNWILIILLTLGLATPLSVEYIQPVSIVEEIAQPLSAWAEIDWYNPQEVIQYIHIVYGKLGKLLTWVVQKESAFDPDAENGNFKGLTQIGPQACNSVGMDYDSVAIYPWLNLEAGARYLKKYCIPAAQGNFEESYKRYNLGPWYDKHLDSLKIKTH
jgi:soluble lytic murein transglycosylase-like protein